MKKQVKSIVIMILVFSLVLSLAGCSGGSNKPGSATPDGSQAAAVKIRIASDLADSAPKSVALRQFEKDVEEASNGAIQVDVFTNNSLGTENQFTDALVNGSVEMASPGTGFAARFHPFAAFDSPNLFSSWDDVRKGLSSDFAKSVFNDMPAQTGVRFLAFTPIGFRDFATVKPVNTLADFKDKKMRAPNISMYLKMTENLGASPVVYSLGELLPALEQKACDGLELPIGTIESSKYYEVAKYVLDTKHMMTIQALMINEKFWQSLSKENQDIIAEAAAKYQANVIDYYEEFEKNALKSMADNGAIVTEPTASFMNDFAAAESNIEDVIESQHPGSKAVIQGIRASLQK